MAASEDDQRSQWASKVPPWVVMLFAAGGLGTGVGNWNWNQNQNAIVERNAERIDGIVRELDHLQKALEMLDAEKVDDDQARRDLMLDAREALRELAEHVISIDRRVTVLESSGNRVPARER